MTNKDKAAALRDLDWHLERYRTARRLAALQALRLHPCDESAQKEVGFHALGVAEALDRLGGSTR